LRQQKANGVAILAQELAQAPSQSCKMEVEKAMDKALAPLRAGEMPSTEPLG